MTASTSRPGAQDPAEHSLTPTATEWAILRVLVRRARSEVSTTTIARLAAIGTPDAEAALRRMADHDWSTARPAGVRVTVHQITDRGLTGYRDCQAELTRAQTSPVTPTMPRMIAVAPLATGIPWLRLAHVVFDSPGITAAEIGLSAGHRSPQEHLRTLQDWGWIYGRGARRYRGGMTPNYYYPNLDYAPTIAELRDLTESYHGGVLGRSEYRIMWALLRDRETWRYAREFMSELHLASNSLTVARRAMLARQWVTQRLDDDKGYRLRLAPNAAIEVEAALQLTRIYYETVGRPLMPEAEHDGDD